MKVMTSLRSCLGKSDRSHEMSNIYVNTYVTFPSNRLTGDNVHPNDDVGLARDGRQMARGDQDTKELIHMDPIKTLRSVPSRIRHENNPRSNR